MATARTYYLVTSLILVSPLKEIKELLKFRSAGLQRRDAIRAAAAAKVADIDARIQDLTAIRDALASLVSTCACSGTKPECPILEALEKK
ncbi:MerR family DNA-binding protein [Salmonella enterica subsp. enterica serovar Dessau]|uniref:MerR family DNA-binding protein n=1 Tax=Salmonella enterica subsp. enterica serovar Dessau TaxID=2564349 RepID=A0A8E5MYP1_SALET|nr:MerR family DNA-binding protein [Salmonella enterica subsp. enterica serovar Dessau]